MLFGIFIQFNIFFFFTNWSMKDVYFLRVGAWVHGHVYLNVFGDSNIIKYSSSVILYKAFFCLKL